LDRTETRAADFYRQSPLLIIQDSKMIGSVALQRIAIPIIPGKFEIRMRSRSVPQNNVIFRIAPIHDQIRQKPAKIPVFYQVCLASFQTLLFTWRPHTKDQVLHERLLLTLLLCTTSCFCFKLLKLNPERCLS
jgi:hypothetical protein